MANNNIQSVQFLRNAEIYANRTLATNALTGLSSPKDGMIALARYSTGDTIYTLAGYYAVSGSNSSVTIFDVEGTSGSIDALRNEINAKLGEGITSANTATAQLAALSGNDSSTSAETSVAGAKKYTDAKLDALDTNSVADVNKIVSDVTQANGQITATAKNITEVKLSGYAEGTDEDIAATDTLGQALGKLQKQINAMDKAASSGSGEVVITVTEEDGKVGEVKSKIKDVLLTGYVKGNGVKPIAETDTINSALSKLENSIDAAQSATTVGSADKSITVTTATSGTDISVNIKSDEHVLAKDGNSGVYTDIKLSAVTPSSTAVREEYSLVGTDGTVLGSNIKIYKDSSLYQAYLGHVDDTITAPDDPTVVPGSGDTALCFIYLKTDGTYELVAVNVEEFIEENEFASGVTWDSTEKKVRGVVDATSEKDESNNPFLTVGADGFKVSGIKDAIDTKINKLDATVTGGTTAGTATSNHIQVIVGEADGKLTGVTVSETNIADKSALEQLSAKTVTEIISSNNSISGVTASTADGTVQYDVTTDASKIKMSGFTAETGGFSAITESSSVTQAIKEIEIITIENEETVSTALNDLETRKAEKTALDSEIAARKAVDGINGDTYTPPTGTHYISNAKSLNDADQKLDAKIYELGGNSVDSATMNGKSVAKTNNTLEFSVNASTSAATSTNAIVIETSTGGGLTFSLGSLDCGTY